MDINLEDFVSFLTIKKGLSKNSLKLCRIRARLVFNWLKENKKLLSKSSLEEYFMYLKGRGLNNNSINTYVFTLRYIQEYYLDRGINNNFFDGFRSFPKVKPLITVLTPQEIEAIINTKIVYGGVRGFHGVPPQKVSELINFRNTTAIMFLAFTGCRYDELASLKVKFLDIETGKVTFIETKNKENRFAHLAGPIIDRLKILVEDKGPEDLVISTLGGGRLHAHDFSYDLKLRAKMAGIKKRVHPHLFRHSFATQLLMTGVDITMVAAILGHKDIQTTFANYVHLADETLKRATFRHPLLRKSIAPIEILKQIRDSISGFKVENDERFAYKLEEGQNSLSFTIFVK